MASVRIIHLLIAFLIVASLGACGHKNPQLNTQVTGLPSNFPASIPVVDGTVIGDTNYDPDKNIWQFTVQSSGKDILVRAVDRLKKAGFNPISKARKGQAAFLSFQGKGYIINVYASQEQGEIPSTVHYSITRRLQP